MLVFGEKKIEAEHNNKAKIGKGHMKERKDVMEMKEKKPQVFGKNEIKAELKNVKK